MAGGPVVLLHGWGGSFGSTFERNGWPADLVAGGKSIIPIDLPGHGEGSSQDPASYTDLAGALAALLPDGQVDLIGYSLGAKLALELASRQPERFGTIIVGGVGDNLFAPEANGEAVAHALVVGLPEDAPPPVRALVEYSRQSGADPNALAAVLRRTPNPIADEARLRRIGARILMVNGSRDGLAQPDTRLRTALNDPAHVLLEGVDHFALPAEAGFRSAAIAFLNAGADLKAGEDQRQSKEHKRASAR